MTVSNYDQVFSVVKYITDLYTHKTKFAKLNKYMVEYDWGHQIVYPVHVAQVMEVSTRKLMLYAYYPRPRIQIELLPDQVAHLICTIMQPSSTSDKMLPQHQIQ